MSAALRVLVRAASLIGVALAGWSNNVQWGTSSVRGGPPAQWERHVVGAALLVALAALAVWLGTRPGASRLVVRGAATAFALGALAVALYLRSRADSLRLLDLIDGPGWTWLVAGTGVAVAAALGSFAVGGEGVIRRSRARRRAAGPRGR
jgi:hypothetical protein